MSDSEDLARVYGDKEIGRILKRATELQDAEPTAPAAGVTLSELEEIAAEAGIAAPYLRRAALELDAGVDEHGFWARVLGEQLRVVREVTVPGVLPESGFERVVAVMQTTSHLHGQPSLLGRTLTWRAETPNKTRTVLVVVSVRGEGTQVRIEENLSQLAGGLFGGTIGGGGLGIGVGLGLPAGMALGSALLATAVPLGIVGMSYVISRSIYRAVVRRRNEAADELLGRIVQEVEACISTVEQGG